MTDIREYLEITDSKYANIARVESASQHALAVRERYSMRRWQSGVISAFEYLYLTEQWTNEDFHSIVDAVSSGSIEFITSAEA